MGANRPLASVDAYPQAFFAAIRDGGAVLYAENLPWTPGSAAKKFRFLIRELRDLSIHPLSAQARLQWHLESTSLALVITLVQAKGWKPNASAPLIDAALRN